MSYKCGECLLFNGAHEECTGGYKDRNATTLACPTSFKGAASLFSGKKCGGCRLFNGAHEECNGGYKSRNTNTIACPNSYSPITGLKDVCRRASPRMPPAMPAMIEGKTMETMFAKSVQHK